MAMGNVIGKMEINILECGLLIRCMALVSLLGKMDNNILEILLEESCQEQEFYCR